MQNDQEEQNKITISRLNRLLSELEYELTRGLHLGFIIEQLQGNKMFHDKDGKLWRFRFELRGLSHEEAFYSTSLADKIYNKLEVIEGGKK